MTLYIFNVKSIKLSNSSIYRKEELQGTYTKNLRSRPKGTLQHCAQDGGSIAPLGGD